MNLKDDFYKADLEITTNRRVLEQIKIADNYAINFVAWIGRNKKENKKIIIIEELLEMYKNQNE